MNRKQRGAAIVEVLLTIPLLMVCIGIGANLFWSLHQIARAEVAADNSALAGAAKLISTDGDTYAAIAAAEAVGDSRGWHSLAAMVSTVQVDVTLSESRPWLFQVPFMGDDMTITKTATAVRNGTVAYLSK